MIRVVVKQCVDAVERAERKRKDCIIVGEHGNGGVIRSPNVATNIAW